MNKFAVVVSVALLAACGAKKDAASDTAVDSSASGSADFVGTYVEHDAAGNVTAKGKTAIKNGKICNTPDGGKEVCN